ncbi:MAG: hypothetical protein H0T43_09130, partial [Solirubrobacterales bacterium]|nr:hypothetical protein [Solirubrobacterales bacterium]
MGRVAVWIVVPAAFCAASAPAQAAPVIGIADQSPRMFASPFFQRLDAPISRIVVSYDAVLRGSVEVGVVDDWMAAARISGVRPLVALNHSRGCFDGTGVAKRVGCRLPSAERYRKAFRAFRRRYPRVTDVSPWNEVNHRSQPTADRPERAASFYRVARRECRGCKIVAADMHDQDGLVGWLARFRRALAVADVPTPRLWGLHNYTDVNDGSTSATRRMLRTVPGTIWLTETGGIVKLGRHRPYSPARAARATRFMFELAGLSPRIARLYIYQWSGSPRSARFDAGLTTPGGRPRPAYHVVRRRLGRR